MMDLPVGTPIKEGMDTSSIDFRKLLPTLREHQLTGYVTTNLLTNNGLEEGVLLYNAGEIIAAEYTYVAKEKSIQGQDALRLVMNACAGDGKFDVYEMDIDKVMGARETNRDAVLKYKPTDEEIMGLIPDVFIDQGLEEEKRALEIKAETVKAMGGISKDDVLKKYNISRPDERMLDNLLKGLGDGAV